MQPVDIRPDHLEIVLDILGRHVPGAEVWVFGSRAKWLARDTSDLDLCIRATEPIGFSRMGVLREAFEESSLPYKVDVVDWATTSESFRKIIERDKIVVQKGNHNQDLRPEWKATTLGQICDDQGGAIQTGPFGSQLHTSDYKVFGVPVVMPTNIGDGGIVEEGIARIDQTDVDRLSQHRLRFGDIVFSRRGDVTKNALIGLHETGWFCGTGCLKVRLGDESIANAKFISHYLRLPDIKEWLIRHAVGATLPNLNTGILSAVPIQLPPLKTQLEIAAMLGALDDKIALLRQTNATLEAIAQALFKSWFVDFDPVRAKAEGREPEGIPPEVADLFPSGFEDSELGEIPKGWRVGKLGEISRNLRVGAKPEELTDDTAYIGLEHMPRQSIALDDWESASKVESGKSRFKNGQILFGKLRPYFHKVGIAPLNGVCSTDILVIEPSSSAWHAVCVCHYSSKALVEHAAQLSNGAKMPRTNWSDLANYQIVIPPEAVAQAFENFVSPLLDRIPENVHQANTLAEIRDTLLPRLMSGKLRIPESPDAIEEDTA